VTLGVAACASQSLHFDARQVQAGFAKHGYPLKTRGYLRFGPIQHVLDLVWVRNGGFRNGILYAREVFYVLVFPSQADAAEALRDPKVARYLRVGGIPAVRRGNVVLTPLYTPVDAPELWGPLKATLASLGR
jgi:hypothetical protein